MDSSHNHAEMRAPRQRETPDHAAVRQNVRQPRVKRIIRQVYGHRLFDENLGAAMAAEVAGKKELARPRWQKENWSLALPTRRIVKEQHHSLFTPYGRLDVSFFCPRCWKVARNDEPLVLRGAPQATIFCGLDAAKAAALIHIADGFGTSVPADDGLGWKIELPTAKTTVPAAPPPSNHHECRLEQHADSDAADKPLITHLDWVSAGWQLRPPTWTNTAHDRFELNTPYGILTIRRRIDWTVEINGIPLVWIVSGKRVIFHELEHAKTIALVHALDHVKDAMDGTGWQNSPF